MYDAELVAEILSQLQMAIGRIERRFQGVCAPNDFLDSDAGLDRLDAIGMMLIAIGESLKNLDRVTEGDLLARYPQIDWRGAKGIRDILSHHYFDLNAEVVFNICREHIPQLGHVIQQMAHDLAQNDLRA